MLNLYDAAACRRQMAEALSSQTNSEETPED
jgi:hypothetical protein